MVKHIFSDHIYDILGIEEGTPLSRRELSYEIQGVYGHLVEHRKNVPLLQSRRLTFSSEDMAHFFGKQVGEYIDFYGFWTNDANPWSRLMRHVIKTHSVRKVYTK